MCKYSEVLPVIRGHAAIYPQSQLSPYHPPSIPLSLSFYLFMSVYQQVFEVTKGDAANLLRTSAAQ